jgi:nitrilase
MRLTAIQMCPGQDKAANIAQATALIEQAIAADRPDLITLPEVWTCLGGNRAAKLAAAEPIPDNIADAEPGSAVHALRSLARRHAIHIHAGSIVEHHPAAGPNRVFNTTLAISPEGSLLARYRKIHMFDITTPDGTGYRESAMFAAGSEVVTFLAGDIRVGCAICYDLRFAELFTALRAAGAELIMLPAAFTLQTGKNHWEPLLRARAIETQCWFAAAATTGTHTGPAGDPRHTWGHTMILDPWGDIVAQCSDGPGFTTARIDRALTARLRRDMPVAEHRRLPPTPAPTLAPNTAPESAQDTAA